MVSENPSASIPCVAGSSPSSATLPSMASPYSQVIRPFLEKSCHPSEAPTYPALDLEKPQSLNRHSAASTIKGCLSLSTSDYESGGQEFESLRARAKKSSISRTDMSLRKRSRDSQETLHARRPFKNSEMLSTDFRREGLISATKWRVVYKSFSASSRNSSGTDREGSNTTDPYPTASYPKRLRIMSTARSAVQRAIPKTCSSAGFLPSADWALSQ